MAFLRWSPAKKGNRTLPERALSLNLIDKRDTGSGSKHCHRVHFPYVPVTEDDGARGQFGTFERARGDTNGHQLGHQNGHHLHKFGVRWPEGIHKDTSGHKKRCPLVFHRDPARIQISGGLGAMASRGHAAGESSEGRRNLARSSFVVFAGCGIIRVEKRPNGVVSWRGIMSGIDVWALSR